MKEDGVIQDVLQWDEVVAKYNKDSKRWLKLGSKIIIIIVEKETQKQKINKYKIREGKQRGREGSYSERMRDK